jgi:STE24 endopeptidase
MPERRAALAWLVVTGLGLLVLAALVVPWDWTPGARMPPVDPTAGLPPQSLARIHAYSDRASALGLGATAVGLLVTLLLGLTPWGSRLAARLPGRRWWPAQVLITVLVVALVGRVVTLPFAIPAERLRRRYGLSTQDWGSYTLDRLRDLLVTVVVTTLVMVVVLALARSGRRAWWLVASLLAGGLVVVGSFVYPIVIEPLYNTFTPMKDGPLKASLVALAAMDGIRVDDVLEADASRRTTTVNAYVSGFGATKRIVVYDTLVDTTPPAQVRQVVAHELGHAKSHDVVTGTALGALGAMAGTSLLLLVAGCGPVRRRAGVDALRSATAVPMLVSLVAVGSLLALPAQNAVSRAIEARADRHSLELTGDPDTLVALQQRLAVTNLNDPDPPRWRYLLFATHPTTAQRVALAEAWPDH